MTTDELAAVLELITGHAPKLREAGVSSVSLEGVTFALLPGAAAEEAPTPTDSQASSDNVDDEDEPGDVLRSPWTHGRPGSNAPKSLTVQRRRL